MNKNRKKLTMESKIRTFSIKVYDEQLPDGWEDVCNRIRNYDASIAQIQGIRHYKDFLDDDFWQPSAEKSHYHIIGRFLNGKSFRVRNILADLNVVFRQEDAELINNHGLETVSHYPNMSVYLTHETEEAILDGKAKYGLDEIISNLTAEELLEIRAGYIRVGQNGGYKKTYNEMAELDLQARELGYNLGDFFEWHYNLDFGTRTNSKLKTIEKSYYDGVLRRVNENSNVVRLCVFIQGAKETGKTFNAEKALRHKRIRKVGGGGSGKFDRLLPSDEVIILDDDTCGNLLNMTDNYMCQTYRRQSNNPFWCGDYFIVTSNYSFREWLERCGLVTYNKDGSDHEHYRAMLSRFYICNIGELDGKYYLACSSPSTRGEPHEQEIRKQKFLDFRKAFNSSLATFKRDKGSVDYNEVVDFFPVTSSPFDEGGVRGVNFAFSHDSFDSIDCKIAYYKHSKPIIYERALKDIKKKFFRLGITTLEGQAYKEGLLNSCIDLELRDALGRHRKIL